MNWKIDGVSKSLSEWKILINSKELPEHEVFDFLRAWWGSESFMPAETSGSTGSPKSIQLEKQFMTSSAVTTGSYFNLKVESTALLCLPLQYIAAKMMLVRALVNNWNIEIIAASIQPKIPETEFDFCSFTPMQMEKLLANDPEAVERIKIILLGGAAVNSSLHKKIERLNSAVYLSYGMTETASHVAIRKLNGRNATEHFHSTGEFKFSSDHRQCLSISHEQSAQQWQTNDTVEILNEKEFKLLGRIDNVINSGGLKIQPEEIESILSNHFEFPFYISSRKDQLLGEKLILVAEGELDAQHIQQQIDKIFNGLPASKKPKEILVLNKLERTANDKIIRRKYD